MRTLKTRALVRLLGAAGALLVLAAPVSRAGSFGIPPGLPAPPTGDPSGYFMLVSADAIDPLVSAALGDAAQFITLYIEVGDPTAGLVVDLYDPGLYNSFGPTNQLDVNLDTMGGVGTMRYVLYGPDPTTGAPDTVLADMSFGSDIGLTDRRLVRLYEDATARAGLYHLVCELEDTVDDTQDISVFGVDVPGHQVYSLNLTVGQANDGGATIAEPLILYPFVNEVSGGSDAIGELCGLQFISYDLDAAMPDTEPPFTQVTTRQGFAFPTSEVPPSGDARWAPRDVGGIDAGFLDSSDHGIWSWAFSDLTQPEDAMGNLVVPIDVNAFSIQVLNYGAGPRDFISWPDVPDRAPFIVFNTDNPRRIYLPDDGGTAPDRAHLEHSATIVSGFPVIADGQTSTVEVTVEVVNPHPYALTEFAGETNVAPGGDLGDPTVTSMTGLDAMATGRRIGFAGTADVDSDGLGDIPPMTTASFTYQLDVSPTALGREFLTGNGADFVSAGAPTMATYLTPYVDPFGFEIPEEVLGPICQIEYEAIVPPCVATAVIEPSAPLTSCPGTMLTLDGSMSTVTDCPGGVLLYQWSVNSTVIVPFSPTATSLDVTPFLDDTYTLEVQCSTDVACTGMDEVTFMLEEAPSVTVMADRTDICLGDAAMLEATAMTVNPPLQNAIWTTDPPGADGDQSTSDMLSVMPAQTTTYTYTTENALGCAASEVVTITVVDPQPRILPANAEICPGEMVEIRSNGGWVAWSWESDPPGLLNDGADTRRIDVEDIGATYTVTVTDALGCMGQASIVIGAAPDDTPGPVGNTLRAEKSGASDLRLSWQDIPDMLSDYELLSLDCDSDLDGTCDVDPTRMALATMADTSVSILPGVQESVEAGGLDRPSWLVFYKIRARSPCTQTPGPFYTAP